MLENSLKKHKELAPVTEERATKSHSKVKLSTLSPSQLLERARNLSNEVRKLSSQNKRLRIMLEKQKQKLCAPNFHPTFDELSEMVNFAVTNKLLKEGSILYSFMLDALSQQKLNQNSYSDARVIERGVQTKIKTTKYAMGPPYYKTCCKSLSQM